MVLKRWWSQGDHYDWLKGYLHARGWGRGTRVMMALVSASLTANVITLRASVDGPHGPVRTAMTVVAFAGGAAAAVLWSWRWPTRRESVAFVVASNASIALICLAVDDPLAALTGCVAFALTGAYVALFHASGLVVYNFVIATAVGAYEALRLTAAGRGAVAVSDLWLVLSVNIALPVAISLLVRALGIDLVGADRDPLTGLLNRRSFRRTVRAMVAARRPQDSYLAVVVVDLDDFKSVNDTYGHDTGDQVLVNVARAVRAATRGGAAIARTGGEEFIVADTVAGADATALAQRICEVIAALPDPVTASVGAATAPLGGVDDGLIGARVKDLIDAADAAMYHAKRSGRNQVHQQKPVDAQELSPMESAAD